MRKHKRPILAFILLAVTIFVCGELVLFAANEKGWFRFAVALVITVVGLIFVFTDRKL